MPQCPKCRSFNVAHKDKKFHELDHRAKHYAAHGVAHLSTPMVLVSLGSLGVNKLIHALSPTYTCQNPNCGHRFS